MTTVLAVLAFVAAALVPLALTAGYWAPLLTDRVLGTVAWLRAGRAGHVERRRAERTARELLHTCLDDESWAMYRDLGFVRVWGGGGRAPAPSGRRPGPGVAYAYLVYPHRPHVVFLPQTSTLLGECRVQLAGLDAGDPLVPTDDVLAHWMALTQDERGVVASARIGFPGTELSRRAVRRDLWRLREWESQRTERALGLVRPGRLQRAVRGRAAG
ncbi:hypothetical protein [Patulibacter sp.]|uniref:hypothetical protein n=1 Tax=Patulibacter sp. TaxID=1912859 RepID=UPI002717CEA0|nr:hypothetical protein [Patulibacter sp.]MDO9408561.1 hypothetical protein [Patulibacter sp.]